MSDYSADHTSALADVQDAGAAVTFTMTGQGVYDPLTDSRATADDLVVTGYAVEQAGSLFTYQALSLIASQARTLFVVCDNYGDLPPIGSTVVWSGATYTVKNVQPISVNGDAIASTVVIAL